MEKLLYTNNKKIKLFLILFMNISLSSIFSQNTAEQNCAFYLDSTIKLTIYTKLDSPAVFKNSTLDYIKFIREKIKPHRVEETFNKIRFYLIINEMGVVIHVGFYEIHEGSIPKQIKKAFLKNKNWKPAKCNGKKVLYRFEGVYLV